MKVLLFYQDKRYLNILNLTPEEEKLLNHYEDVDEYEPMMQILDNRGLEHDVFTPIWSIDYTDKGFPVYEDNDGISTYVIK